MPSSDEREIILEHALKNQENLETTLDIGFAFSELRRRIIVGFLEKLGTFVLDELRQHSDDGSEWEIVIDDYHRDLRSSPLEKHLRFGFGKTSWRRRYGVALEPHKDNACEVIIGVWREYNKKTKRGARRFQPQDHLRKELNHKIRNVGTNDNPYWEWHHALDVPYRNWNTKETLIKLYNGEAVEKRGQEFVRILKVAERIIDEHVQKS